MLILGVPVPPGFTITTDVCREYRRSGGLPAAFASDLKHSVEWLEGEAGKLFGDFSHPLLLSVRSGAPVSMPGMMDTVLNVGLNDTIVQTWGKSLGSEKFALDSYKGLIQMFGSVVLDVPKHLFEAAAGAIRGHVGNEQGDLWTTRELSHAIDAYQDVIKAHNGRDLPQGPSVQLAMTVEAVFRSWQSDRAKYYRKINSISQHGNGGDGADNGLREPERRQRNRCRFHEKSV